MPLRAILFDKDGTFVDFQATWGPTVHWVMRRMAGDDEAKLARLVDVNHFDVETGRIRPTSPIIASSSADYGVAWAAALGEAPDQVFFSRMDAFFMEATLKNITAIGEPGAMFAELAREGYTLGVVTNDSEGSARAHCARLGLTDHFRAILGYDSGHGRKPTPGQIEAFNRIHGFAPEETALVGDTLHDVHAAKAAGATAIAVLSGFAREEDFAGEADHILPDIMALPALLRSLRG